MFTTAPRWFGYPIQEYVTSKLGLEHLIQSMNGKRPCFVSEYVFPHKAEPLVDKIFFDFDDKNSLKGPYHDCQKLSEFNEKLGNPTIKVFSGNKGYHLHMPLKAVKMTAMELWALHYSIYKELNLTHADKHCFGVLRQIVRVPTTMHIDKFNISNGRYCRYLTDREFAKGVMNSIKVSKEPGVMPESPNSSLSFGELTSHLKHYQEILKKATTREGLNITIERNREHISSVNVIAPTCLNIGIQEWNPTHLTRFETTCWLKFIGYSNLAIVNLYSHIGWRDFNEEVTKYMVVRTRARLPSCPKLEAVTEHKYCRECPLRRLEDGNIC